jgi:predicted GNAT superfamily acetyltransferase
MMNTSRLNEERAQNCNETITVRECTSVPEFDACVRLQREAFNLPDIELSPRRHLIVSRMAGGWTLGAFVEEKMVGFVHHLVALSATRDVIGYSHMMAVAVDFQNKGVGARLKWAQRERALHEKVNFIKWTWDPMRARNAHFNLNRLGVIVRAYAANFYGTDYPNIADDSRQGVPKKSGIDEKHGIDSDRLLGEWHLNAPRVCALAQGVTPEIDHRPARIIEIPPDWSALIKRDPHEAQREQLRVRDEFKRAFADNLICAGFARDQAQPRYLLYQGDR